MNISSEKMISKLLERIANLTAELAAKDVYIEELLSGRTQEAQEDQSQNGQAVDQEEDFNGSRLQEG